MSKEIEQPMQNVDETMQEIEQNKDLPNTPLASGTSYWKDENGVVQKYPTEQNNSWEEEFDKKFGYDEPDETRGIFWHPVYKENIFDFIFHQKQLSYNEGAEGKAEKWYIRGFNEALELVEKKTIKVKEAVRTQTGSFKYDDQYDDILSIIEKLKK